MLNEVVDEVVGGADRCWDTTRAYGSRVRATF